MFSTYVSGNQPEVDANARLCATVGIRTSWQYRKYMTDNADAIRAHNLRDAGGGASPSHPNVTKQGGGGGFASTTWGRGEPLQVDWQTHTPYLYTSIADRHIVPGVTNAPQQYALNVDSFIGTNDMRDNFINKMESLDNTINKPPKVHSMDHVRKLLRGGVNNAA
jgi:hypothetical protein